mgnify:CR=1 FL=1
MKYLAAVDLSEASLLALDALRALAQGEKGDVTLLHVVDLDLYTAGGSVPGIMEFAKERLSQEAKRLAGCGLSTPAIRVEQGDSAQTIVRVAMEEQADLIVMTNLGKGARTGRLFGSTAERVASSGTVPVLIERVGIDEGDGGECCRLTEESSLSRLLIAVDLDHDPRALRDAALGIPGVGETRIVHVVRTEADVASALERLRSHESTSPVATGGQPVVLVGDPAEAIVKEASEWGATAIALGPCAHGVVHRAVWGSVARAVALGAGCSILFVASED